MSTDLAYPTPEDAEAAFYGAFSASDLAAMMGVWATTDDVECIHPMGERIAGYEAVRASWELIFANNPHMQFSIQQRRATQSADLAVHVVEEIIVVRSEDATLVGHMVATNVYVRSAGSWRMVLHHASPVPQPEGDPETAEADAPPSGTPMH